MRKVTQSRTGNRGTCFRSCMASIFNLREQDVPDWPQANEDPGVNRWLAGRGLRYEQVPIDENAPPPVGWHTIEGTSPRGGQHAIVGHNGRPVWDPHPQDGTGRGLVEPRYWGLLLPAAAKDAVTLHPDKDGEMQLRYTALDVKPPRVYNCTKCGARRCARRGDVCEVCKERAKAHDASGSSAHAYHDALKATVPRPAGEVLGFVQEVAELLAASRIRDKAVWAERMSKARAAARQGKTEYAFTAAHHVLDALRSLERRRGR